MRQEEELCQQHTVLHVFSIRPSGLCHSYCDPLPNAPQKKKKKAREEKGSSNVFSRLAGNELRAARKRYAGHSLELRNDVGATLHGGDTGGERKGRGLGFRRVLASPVWTDPWSSHTDGDWLICPSHLQPRRPLTLISSVQNTRLHTARLFLPTCGLQLEQWFITNYRRRYREMCVNAVQHEWSRLQLMKLWWNRRKKNCQRVRKGIRNLSFAHQKYGIFKYFTNFVNYYKIKKKCKQPGYLHREENLILIEYKHEI